jgi:DNA polymerase III subunit alpha
MQFVNLHSHTDYSALDGFSQIKDIVTRVKQIGQTAIAITDHGNLSGCYKFYTECKKNGIKPILGIEFYAVDNYESKDKPYHLTVLAKNNSGWKKLLKLNKIANKNFYYKPRISMTDLILNKEGLIVLSGCIFGIAARNIKEDNNQLSIDLCLKFKKEFGDDFYIEVMDHKLDFQQVVNPKLRAIAKGLEIKTVCTNDSHYTVKEDFVYQDYLVCDNLKQSVKDERDFGLKVPEFYIKDVPDLYCTKEEIETSVEIADKCNVEIKFNGFLLPKPYDLNFIDLVKTGLKNRGLEDLPQEYRERLNYEYTVIKDANLIGYFMVVQDYVNWAKTNGILVGPGRGSVGGSLVAYSLGIHDVDPIKHKLLFSRFYNAGRSGSLPDIDIDFPESKIELVKAYVQEKYGKERTAQIGTFSYLHKKSALKLVCRVLGIEFDVANRYSSIIEDVTAHERLKMSDNMYKDICEKSEKFEGLSVHNSVHAAGIIISPIDLDEIIPLRINRDNGLYVSEWDMKDIEKVGLVKFDFLSLNTLDVIQDTLSQVEISLESIPMDDKETFNSINTTNNVGIFQLSSDGISKTANEMKVESIDDIAVVVALYRPGPINSGMNTMYIDRKIGKEPVTYLTPLLEKVLKDTYGIFVFQEQTTEAAMVLAGFSENEADNLRKAIGKKIPELMDEQKDKFIKGCQKNNIDNAEKIWGEIEEFSGYGFNRSHSVEYGYITYYTAYLKTHYPSQFMAALLNNNYTDSAKLSKYLDECSKLGIEVIPPSVTKGSYDFIAHKNKIIFGFKGINGIGEKTARELYKNSYSSLEDFFVKFKPSSDIAVALTEAGVFDEFGYNRASILSSISDIIKYNKVKRNPKLRSLFNNEGIKIRISDELDERVLANKEYDRLNTYLVYNPLKKMDLLCPEEFSETMFFEGYISNITERVTKKSKETMATLDVITKLGKIQCLVFPKMYRKNKGNIAIYTYVAIDGRYDGKVIVSSIWRKNV